MPLGPQIITFGNVQSTWVLTLTLTFVATGATTTAEQNIVVPGLAIGDQISDISLVSWAFPNTLLSIVNARVSAANTLTVAIANGTLATSTIPPGTVADSTLTGMVRCGIDVPAVGMVVAACACPSVLGGAVPVPSQNSLT